MRLKLIPANAWVWLATVLVALVCAPTRAQAAGMKLEATLVWGTDESKPPEGKDYKPVDPELLKKLKDLPLKWSHYWVVNRKELSVAHGATVTAPLSDKCELQVKNVDGASVEVRLVGKGKEVMNRKQALPKGEVLALGGNAPNSTAWLVIVRRIE